MIGISKKELIDFDPWQYDNQQDLLNAILKECHELDPWLPIDENTPNDLNLLLTKNNEKIQYIGYYDSCLNMWCVQGAIDYTPTCYKKLQPPQNDPKNS